MNALYPDTALHHAFRDAGLADPEAALMEIAVAAWRKASASTYKAAGERREHVMKKLRQRPYIEDKQYFNLAFELFNWWNPTAMTQAVDWLLDRAAEQIRHQAQNTDTGDEPVGGGQLRNDTHVAGAPATPSTEGAKVLPLRHPEPPTVTAKPSRGRGDMIGGMGPILEIEKSLLDDFRINNTPIRVCQVSEVRNWIAIHEPIFRKAGRDILFAKNLVANLPGDAVIGDYWKDEKAVTKLYENACRDFGLKTKGGSDDAA